jgi:hypothetical protein
MAAAVDPAVGAIIGQIPPRERDWADVAELLGSADPDAVKCRYGRDGGSL